MLYQLMSATGFVFWAVVAVLVLINALCLGRDSPIGALVFSFLALCGLLVFTDLFAGASLFWIALLVPAYLAIGVGWAFWKWRAFILDKRTAAKAAYVRETATYDPAKPLPNFNDWAERNGYRRPTATEHADRLTAWIALWPWSMSWLVLRFPWRLCVLLYERLSTVFERMSEKLWAD